MEGHFARECQRNRNRLQAEEIRCSICSEVGHVARGCPHKGLYGIF
jgi:LSD1 subclass zinc finger protein